MGDIVRVSKPGAPLSARPGPSAKGTTMAGDDLGSLLGGLLGGSGGQGGSAGGGAGGAGNVLGALLGALMGGSGGSQAGGSNPLGGLLDMLTKSGLADQAQSWIGTGDNQSVSGAQIADALPDEALQKAAAQAGVSPQEAADQIAQALPTAVDKLSPEGQLPTGSLEEIIRAQKF
ncbi:YidB family protein [Streptomyces sp. NPDC085540]|uniref:YidB family protein n=1 Tax=Streptomyces sp. NPDC085540 TaxID=3365730 RepID=UPI0037D064F1